ncbi:MarR family transcriptional regulator [Corynebacterium poyangense]|uniref:MarR family transcriptional regulator n=1 Tax=Corynebacterium poyangense TaxID=2684405 RepID=A0A7H0SSG1_9CORY|nr:MarR family transcriptional regulator [Corynebacterium poyangense]QNQ91486.1 MarR family transcriptional regulator [Corynebacterium poyangense]
MKDPLKSAELFRYLILALQRQGSRELNQKLARLNLTASQAEAIEIVGTQGPLTTREVGAQLVCETGSPSRLLSTLAQKGFIVRSTPEQDRRATLHSLTKFGRQTLGNIQQLNQEFYQHLAEDLAKVHSNEQMDIVTQIARLIQSPTMRETLHQRFPEYFKSEDFANIPTLGVKKT